MPRSCVLAQAELVAKKEPRHHNLSLSQKSPRSVAVCGGNYEDLVYDASGAVHSVAQLKSCGFLPGIETGGISATLRFQLV